MFSFIRNLTFPPTTSGSSSCSAATLTFGIVSLSASSLSGGCAVTAHHDFNLHFPNNDFEHLHRTSFLKCLLCSFLNWAVCLFTITQ